MRSLLFQIKGQEVVFCLKLPCLWLAEEKDKSVICIALKIFFLRKGNHKETQFTSYWNLAYTKSEIYRGQVPSGNTKWSFSLSLLFVQYCVNFCYTTKWFSYPYIHYYILFHYGLSQDIKYKSLCYTVRLCYLSILYMIICI